MFINYLKVYKIYIKIKISVILFFFYN